jgi:hypothetical protein
MGCCLLHCASALELQPFSEGTVKNLLMLMLLVFAAVKNLLKSLHFRKLALFWCLHCFAAASVFASVHLYL